MTKTYGFMDDNETDNGVILQYIIQNTIKITGVKNGFQNDEGYSGRIPENIGGVLATVIGEVPNFGFADWQASCSSWCAVRFFSGKVEASSVLTSNDNRHSEENILIENRFSAWAEGINGDGIGEYVRYKQACNTGYFDNKMLF